MKVNTLKGLIDISDLEVKDIVTQEDNARITATEWYFKNELVRRDVNANILRGLALAGEQSKI